MSNFLVPTISSTAVAPWFQPTPHNATVQQVIPIQLYSSAWWWCYRNDGATYVELIVGTKKLLINFYAIFPILASIFPSFSRLLPRSWNSDQYLVWWCSGRFYGGGSQAYPYLWVRDKSIRCSQEEPEPWRAPHTRNQRHFTQRSWSFRHTKLVLDHLHGICRCDSWLYRAPYIVLAYHTPRLFISFLKFLSSQPKRNRNYSSYGNWQELLFLWQELPSKGNFEFGFKRTSNVGEPQ